MYDQFVYETAVDQLTAIAIARNQNERVYWTNRRDSWLQNSVVRLALGLEPDNKPAAPARLMKIDAPAWTPDATQDEIKIVFGPELVADPACDLPAPPAARPIGVAHVRQYEGWGDTWSAYPDDTMKTGDVIDHVDPARGPVRLRKNADPGFGGIPNNFYKLVA